MRGFARRGIGALAGGLLIFGAAFSGSMGTAGPAAARTADVFTITEVPVDASADSATVAREMAQNQGRVEAFNRLLKRLTLPEDWPRLPQLSAQELLDYEISFQVDNERRSARRYLADMTFAFHGPDVQDLLRSKGIAFSASQARPVLVLPVWRDGETFTLWGEEKNPWFQAFLDRNLSHELVPLTLPMGDLLDLSTLDGQSAVDAEWADVEPLAERYEVDTVLVAVASPQEGGGLDVELHPIEEPRRQIDPYGQGASPFAPGAAGDLPDGVDSLSGERRAGRYDSYGDPYASGDDERNARGEDTYGISEDDYYDPYLDAPEPDSIFGGADSGEYPGEDGLEERGAPADDRSGDPADLALRRGDRADEDGAGQAGDGKGVDGEEVDGEAPGDEEPVEVDPEALDNAVTTIVADLQARWKEQTAFSGYGSQELNAIVQFDSFRAWLDLRERLERVALITRVVPVSMNINGADLLVEYNGSLEQLEINLQQQDVYLAWVGDHWSIGRGQPPLNASPYGARPGYGAQTGYGAMPGPGAQPLYGGPPEAYGTPRTGYRAPPPRSAPRDRWQRPPPRRDRDDEDRDDEDRDDEDWDDEDWDDEDWDEDEWREPADADDDARG